MVQREIDPLNGAARRDVLMSSEDAESMGISPGDRVRLRSEAGAFEGRARIAPIHPGNLQVHWPEAGGLLIPGKLDPVSLEPDYNATVVVEKIVEKIDAG